MIPLDDLERALKGLPRPPISVKSRICWLPDEVDRSQDGFLGHALDLTNRVAWDSDTQGSLFDHLRNGGALPFYDFPNIPEIDLDRGVFVLFPNGLVGEPEFAAPGSIAVEWRPPPPMTVLD